MYGAGSTTADIKDEAAFERSWNRAEGVILAILALIVAGGLLGAFGSGPLAHAELAAQQHDLTIAYDRIGRKSAETAVVIKWVASGATSRIVMDPDLAQDVSVTVPQPLTAAALDEGPGLTFATEPNGRVEIVLHLKPKTTGLFSRHITVNDVPLTFTQLIWP